MTMLIRVKLLEKLMERIAPIPDDWVPGGRKLDAGTGSVTMDTLPCESWEELITTCKKAMKWTEGLDRGFSVCMAALLGTGSLGSQLWIRLMGPPSCLDGDTPIYDPMDGTTKTVRERWEIGQCFHVWSRTKRGKIKVMEAYPPARFAPAPMFRVKLVSGKEITVTDGHQFWTGYNYTSLEELRSNPRRYTGIDGDDFKSIEELEPREYYDFHVPVTNSYFAAGLWHHNCGKSTIFEAMSVNRCHVKALSTVRGFHSGFKDDSGTNKSLILELKGKTLITKDADSMVSSPNWPQIMGEARDLFDRTARSDYRNGMGMNHDAINMTWLLGGTAALRNSDMNELGARFVDCVIMEGIDEELEMDVNRRVISRAFKNVVSRSNGTMQTQLDPAMVTMMQMTGGYIDFLHANAEELLGKVQIDEHIADQIINMAVFVAYMRARPSLRQQETTEREFSARLVEQFARLAVCLAAVMGKTSVDDEVLRRVVRCAMDTARGRTLEIVKYLHEEGDNGLETRALSILTCQNDQEERKMLQFLRKLGAVELWTDKEHGNRKAWRLMPRLSRLYAEVISYA